MLQIVHDNTYYRIFYSWSKLVLSHIDANNLVQIVTFYAGEKKSWTWYANNYHLLLCIKNLSTIVHYDELNLNQV